MELTNIPHNNEAEKALLGSLMMRPKDLYSIMGKVPTDAFYEPINGKIYTAMKSLLVKNMPIDLVTVTTELRNIKAGVDIDYINGLLVSVPLSNRAEYYAKIVMKNHTLRNLMIIGYSLIEDTSEANESSDTDKIITKHATQLIGIDGGKKEESDITDAIQEFNETQEQFKAKLLDGTTSYIGIPTGFSKIDDIIDGLRPGHMHLIGGFTSSGKTQFMLNIIDNIISTTKVTLFSLEMSRVDIIARLLGIRTGIGASKILRHEFSEQWELDEYEIAKKRLVDSGLKIYSQTNLLDDIIMSMTRDIVINKTKVFAIDYAQLVRTKSNNEYEQISETAQRLQNFARENGVTIIILSQISNEHSKDQNRETMGFKGGGTLPASADLAIELVNVDNREERAQKLMDKIPFSVNCIVRKNRHGRTGIINFDFSPWNGKFEQSLMN